jgi:methionyl-tRNA formyltransferase
MLTKLRILFMGTPAFALPALEMLHGSGYPIAAVVTQPDRPAGREKKETAPPVKQMAQKLGLKVLQPASVKDPSFLEALRAVRPDLVVVAAFGQILPKAVLDLPPLGCLNIHPSLLPAYRGAAPINWSIIRGEKQTGVTIMLMDEGMDSGDILTQEQTPIGKTETYGELHDRLAAQGATLLVKTIDRIVAGNAQRQKQDSSRATFAPRLNRETGRIRWRNPACDIVNLIRGLSPSPAAYTLLEGQDLKIFTAAARPGSPQEPPGSVAAATAEGLPVAASGGYVVLKEVQMAGKKRMPVSDFLRGFKMKPGILLE